MADSLDEPLILKKKIKIPPEAHGGAWKIAYADFVTAMMAFFLLLWLLNATTEEQMEGISDFFAPPSVSEESTGIGEALKGLEVMADGAMRSATARPQITAQIPTFGDEQEGQESGEDRGSPIEANPESGATKFEIEEDEALEIAMSRLRQSVQDTPEVAELQDSLSLEDTPEGLLIQILDQKEKSMFEGSSARLTRYAERLLALIGVIVSELPNSIEVSGHTDAGPYQSITPNYGKWELTADRATAAQKWLLENGLPEDRFVSIIGRADTDLLDRQEPEAPRNRRIGILLLRQSQSGDGG